VLAGSANERSSLRQATSGRSDLLSGGFDLFTARPVLGWGSGAFAREYERHKEEPSARAVSASHTIPLTVAAEQGIVGLAAYLALLVVAFRVLLRRARDSLPRAAVGAAFAALVLHTLLYAAFLEDPLAWALLAVGAALAQRSSWATSLSPTWRWLA
jgi:O-antigen ligase